jgi:hypothetical protein
MAAKGQLKQNAAESQPARPPVLPGSSATKGDSLDEGGTGTLQKMIVASGSVAMDLHLNRLNAQSSSLAKDFRVSGAVAQKLGRLHFAVTPNSFFTILVFNNLLRAAETGSMTLIPQNTAKLPASLSASFQQLAVEKLSSDEAFDLAVRDSGTGFTFFNVEGHQYEYDANARALSITNGLLLISKEFANALGRPSDAGAIVGQISVGAVMQPIEIDQLFKGEPQSAVMPALHHPAVGTVPGPHVIVGDLSGLAQFGSAANNRVGLAVGTDSRNKGTIDLDWFALPSNDHPVIPQNLYRVSGGANNNDRFEQVGQSSCKHAFTALTQNLCGFGCNGVGGSHLGSGCSDLYSASLNSGPNLGSRTWINPFTGFFPRGDSPTPPNDHTGHIQDGTSHRFWSEWMI